ncbi:AzlC family ABC transporter permease [Paraconexibacter antarcticus]|uniref:AzlC family ABC transporter permease n=1 Tax=Paraconexibacter antarcticus TaxID=2949664 RepID=A0ABY5DWI7_9ACTN|nr:AzlC family ABC transporter permease [Paraconexibacter antarcticus]UTI66368.1 AzlC family ABC transporter permease [Paraconexibacter antarcticus]
MTADAVPDPARDAGAGAGAQRERSWRAGLAAGVPYGIATGVVAVSFGVLAREAGFSAVAAIVMSAVVFAGSAQFTAVSIIASGGSGVAAVAAAALMNSRFLPMGVALAPSLPGGRWRRAAQGQGVVDSSWAMAGRGDGTFDRWFLFGSTAPQYAGWLGGTILGALAGPVLGNPKDIGLDAVYPAFFVALLIAELRRPGAPPVALVGALIALALIPFTPAGVPVLAASVAALAGIRRPVAVAATTTQEDLA